MEQTAPDGIPIEIKVFDAKNSLVLQDRTTSRLGQGIFKLSREYFELGNYSIEINVAGLSKKMTITIP